MQLTERAGLDERDLAAIAALEGRVVGHDGGRLKLEWATLRQRPAAQVNDLLWWEGERLAGFLGLYTHGAHLELAGMVDPGSRRRRVGTAMLDRALAMGASRGFGRALLAVPGSTPAGRLFVASKEADFDHSEHFLVLDGPPTCSTTRPELTVRPAGAPDAGAVMRARSAVFGEPWAALGAESPGEEQLLVELDGDAVGVLRTCTNADVTSIYGFGVVPGRQGLGIGREVLVRVCRHAFIRGARQVTLEVDVQNERAYGLYRSVGFSRHSTEEYWALPTG